MMDPSYVPAEFKGSIKDALFAGLDDESLQKYKESLLGDIEDIVSMKSTNLDAKLDRKHKQTITKLTNSTIR